MAQNLELETLTTFLDADDKGLDRVLAHAEKAVGISADKIESTIADIQKSIENLSKMDTADFEKGMEDIAKKTIAFRDELKVDQIHAYADAIEAAEKELPKLQQALGGTKQADLFKSAEDVKFWDEFASEATITTSKWNEEIQQTNTEARKMGSSFKSLTGISADLKGILKLTAGFTAFQIMRQVVSEINKELLKRITLEREYTKAVRESEDAQRDLQFITERRSTKQGIQREGLTKAKNIDLLKSDLPMLQKELAGKLSAVKGARRQLEQEEQFGVGKVGMKLFGIDDRGLKQAEKEAGDTQKAFEEARRKIAETEDAIAKLEVAAKSAFNEGVKDLRRELELLSDPTAQFTIELRKSLEVLEDSGLGMKELALQADLMLKKQEKLRELGIRDATEGLSDRTATARAGEDQRALQQLEIAQTKRSLERDQRGFTPEQIEEQLRELGKVQEFENRMEKKEFFKNMRQDAQDFTAELKHVPKDILEMDQALQDMRDKGIFSDDEIAEAEKMMKGNIKTQRQLADRRRGDPDRLGVQAVEARSADSFARLRAQASGEKTPLDSISSNIEKQVSILEEIRDKEFPFAPAGLN